MRRRRRLTWKRPGPLLTPFSQKFQRILELRVWVSIAGQSGKSIGGGWAAAWYCWTKDTAGRKKFRKDVVAQLAKVGLPKPQEPDVDDQAARERAAAWLDQRIAEGPKRTLNVKCAGCGFPRQLKPGRPIVTHAGNL